MSGSVLAVARGLAWASVLLGWLVPAGPSWASPGDPAAVPVLVSRTPHTSSALPLAVRFQLRSGFDLAMERLEEVPGCRGLFGALGGDGFDLLGGASFEVPAGPEQNRLCLRAAAFARPGSGRIVVCPVRIRALNRRGVAAVLLHEALHLAGLSEWPYDPEALTSREITELVRSRCRL